MVIGVTPQEVAISAMVNWRASYIRWALSMRLAVILGLRPPLRPRLRAAMRPGLGALLDESGFVFRHQGKHAEDEFAVGGGGVDDAVGQRLHADAAAFQGGDDVDQ